MPHAGIQVPEPAHQQERQRERRPRGDEAERLLEALVPAGDEGHEDGAGHGEEDEQRDEVRAEEAHDQRR
jgi:hypothetical protein